MTRRYDDPVDVRPAGAEGACSVPGQFVWRGRLFVVREVLAHWREAGTWWAGADIGGDGRCPADPVSGGQDDLDERELWRVEASSGRVFGSGVYDLQRDPRAGSWTLARALD